MDREWADKILLTSQERENEGKDKEFVKLVYQVEGKCTLEITRVLMKTFFDKDDFGTQESVNSVLATADNDIVVQSLLEELPRLAKDAPEWAHSLVRERLGTEPKLLEEKLAHMPSLTKEIVKKIIENQRLIESDSLYKDYSAYNNLIRNISDL